MFEEYRKSIDKIDLELLSLLARRKNLTDNVMQIKLANALPLNDSTRESEIIQKLQGASASLNPAFVEHLFSVIFEHSKHEHYLKETFQTIDEYIQRRAPLVIAGPCTVESEQQINTIAAELAPMGVKFLRGGAYKPRTVASSFQGLESAGVKLLHQAARQQKMYTVTEVLEASQYEQNRDFIDIIQIGSRSMTSFGLLKSIGKMSATDGKYVLIKRGLSATIEEFLNAVDYVLQAGNSRVILCLRGIRTFEQIASDMRFTVDLASILELKEKTQLPILFDPSHSTGNARYVSAVSNAALKMGADGLLVEVHNSPETALVDGKQSITPKKLAQILGLW